MKKTLFYLVLLSLMSCHKELYVSCDTPSNDAEIAKSLITGRWELERTRFASRRFGKVIYLTKKDLPHYVLIFQGKGTLQLFRNDTLIGDGSFKFIKEKDIAPTSNSDLNLLFMNKVELPGEFEGVVPFKICNDSLYLPFQSYASDATPDQVWSKK